MSDFEKSYKVTGIQGHAVSTTAPNDGDTLVWSDSNEHYVPRPVGGGGLTKVYFTSDGYWTCPEGITTVIVSGSSGGWGGVGGGGYVSGGVNGPGLFAMGGVAGQAGVYKTHPINVIPGAVYSVTIGQGGLGQPGFVRENSPPNFYQPDISVKGGNTYLGNIFKAKINSNYTNGFGSENDIGCFVGGDSPANLYNTDPINPQPMFYSGDAWGGQAGTQGNGGDGGAAGAVGVSANANSGAGGGGGGGNNTDSGDGSGFAGGNGGSGYLYIIY